MKILLVMPHPPRKRRGILDRFSYPSLTLQQIAGITPRRHSVTIVDERYEDINFNKHYDLVGISCLTYNAIRGYEVADEFRRRGIPVVFGGYHAARHDIGVYTVMEAIQASRGCPTGCEFCAMQKIEGPRFRGRPVDNVIEEMKIIKSKTIFFADASLTISPPYTKSLFKKMASLNKKFHCFGNINVLARDDEFLKLASDAGVDRWYVGIESITQENIDLSGKRTNRVENYRKAIEKIRDYGMTVTGFFMFGFDNDTPDIFERTLQFMLDLDLDGISFKRLV